MFETTQNTQSLEVVRRRTLFDRLVKYIVDPRRLSHKYLLQFLLCVFLSGPTFFDNFFNACATDIMLRLAITHEEFSLLISVPSITGILCGAVAGMVALYGSTRTAIATALISFAGAGIIAYGIQTASYTTIMIGRIVFVLCWNLLGSVQKVIVFRQFTGPALAWIFAMKILAIRVGAVSGLYFAGDIMMHVNGSLPAAMTLALALSGVSLVCTLAFGYLYRGSSTARLVRPIMMGRRRDRPSDFLSSGFSLQVPSDTWICCIIIFFYYGGLVPFETFGVDYLVTEYGMTKTDAGQALALIPFFSFFSPLISPFVSSIRRQVISAIVAQAVVATSIVLEMLKVPYAPYLYLCAMGVGHMVVANALWLALAGVSPTEAQKTNAASISSAIYAFTAFAFNWMTGRIRDAAGDYEPALAIMAALILVGTCMAVYLLGWGNWREPVMNPQALQILLPPESEDDDAQPSISITDRTIIDDNHFGPPPCHSP